ncbi:MAG: ABC transporter ATP-binding protein [Prosthecobacter sp.]|uniref:ABC transporter ATP-binding protein n=1 Tax=Prosthecobacter sp. TaxID=1965333 RepID=UPI0039029B53
MALLEVRHLTKRWPTGRLALDDVSFQVKEGEILGLLGHNGAGKSTIMGITLGMVRPDLGEVRIGGHSVQQARGRALQQIGAIYEAAVFYEYLSGWQNLRVLCSLSGWWDEAEVKRVVQMVNLTRAIQQKAATYSHGMRQRLALAQALLPQPKILLLDEPTDGLDPEGIREFRELILHLRKQHGLTIMLNSHLLGEIEQMCDRCVILKDGKKVYEGPVPSQEKSKRLYLLETTDLGLAREVLDRSGATMDKHGIVEVPQHMEPHELIAALVRGTVQVNAWQPHHRTLEELYMGLSSKS